MKKKLLYPFSFLLTIITLSFSCSKEKNNESDVLYGRWETSYGDTITFSRTGNKNILNYDVSLNPAFMPRANHEFIYQNKKLGIKNGRNSPNSFYFFQSFRWIREGSLFELQGVDWFLFLSSTQTYFTFTKVP